MKVLLVNPPIYDFAAYDFWMKPLGLLYLSSMLREKGHEVKLIDATDRGDPYFQNTKNDKFGRGKIPAEEVDKPEPLKDIPRRYRRYGLPEKIIRKRVTDFKPDIVMVSVTMTYWYPGAVEIKEMVRNISDGSKILLGGIYPSLMHEHAESLGFDSIYRINDRYIKELDLKIPSSFSDFPAPDYSHYKNLEYAAIATSIGCIFKCPYCSSPILYSQKQDMEAEKVVGHIEYLSERGIRKFAFYDDALLYPQDRFIEIIRRIKKKKIPALFFIPNGLHSRFINREIAEAMAESNFREPRVSLETADPELQKQLNSKTTLSQYENAITSLKNAGYSGKNIYTYLLAGLPGQSFESVNRSIMEVGKRGVKISLAEFSPIPGTLLEQNLSDPLLTNNTAYYHHMNLSGKMEKSKALVKWVNRGIDLNIPVDKIKDYL